MFFVLVKRIVKHPTGKTERYALRAANVVSWTVNGPFTERRRAEEAAASALATPTCLSALVASRHDLEKVENPLDYDLGNAARLALKMFSGAH